MQTGKPHMIEHSPFIGSVEEWQRSALACENDVLLCAFVKLRLLAAGIPRAVFRTEQSRHETQPLIRLLQTGVKQWAGHWSNVAAIGKPANA